MAFLLAAAIGALALPSAAAADVLYADGFESWSVGAYPAPPWSVMFGGQNAFVTDVQAHAGAQSLRSESFSSSARWDYVALSSIPDLLDYAGSVLVESAERGCGLGFAYVDPTAPNTGWAANAVIFDNDGMIRFYSRSIGSVDLVPWSPGVWYDVYAQIDYVQLRAEVFVDGVLVGHGLPTEPKILTYYPVPVPLDKFGFLGNNFGGGGVGVQYLDDVALISDAVVPTARPSWGRIKALYR